jgi:hypothetical protein
LDSPEVHQPHAPHGGLPRWLELVIAVTALITSVSSIAIALHHGQVMERLVQANSIPYMQAGFSDATLEGDDVISLDLLNRGVGPAHEKSLRVKVGDRYVRSVPELISASLGVANPAEAQKALHFTWNAVPTRFVPGGQSQFIFRTARTDENAAVWDRFHAAQPNWSVEFCYCSVFDECWDVRGKWSEPQPVKQCVRDEAKEFFP